MSYKRWLQKKVIEYVKEQEQDRQEVHRDEIINHFRNQSYVSWVTKPNSVQVWVAIQALILTGELEDK